MGKFGSDAVRDEVLLGARILLVVLYIVFGWSKLNDYSGTVAYMAQSGAPLPPVAAVVAIVIEFFVSIGIVLGILTRPIAIVLALYTLATGFIGHHYWTMTGAEQAGNMINFYKNVSIVGGFLLLYVIGPGKYSIDARLAPP